jgi:hypothetical protein
MVGIIGPGVVGRCQGCPRFVPAGAAGRNGSSVPGCWMREKTALVSLEPLPRFADRKDTHKVGKLQDEKWNRRLVPGVI